MPEKIQINDDVGEVLKTYSVPDGRHQFEGADLWSECLQGAQVAGANFKGAILDRLMLNTANLDDASFEIASLQGADFASASCVGTNFRNVDFGCGPVGGGARLQGADLTRAIPNGAHLNGATFDENTKFPKGFFPLSHGMIETAT
jgi:uncharacterized protein YjbI with pentapeptide repeats